MVIGIETTDHYYEDLVSLCEEKEYFVSIINVATKAKEWVTVLNFTKKDDEELMAITQSILHGWGWTSEEAFPFTPLLAQLKTLSRADRALIYAHSQTVNHARLLWTTSFGSFKAALRKWMSRRVNWRSFRPLIRRLRATWCATIHIRRFFSIRERVCAGFRLSRT